MATIHLITGDENLVIRVRAGLGVGDTLLHDHREPRRFAAVTSGERLLVGLDCRALEPAEVRNSLMRMSDLVGAETGARVTALTDLGSRLATRTMIAANGLVEEAVLADVDDPGVLLRVLANDPFGSLQSAVACRCVTRELPAYHRWAETVIASLGHKPAVTSVKELARATGVHKRGLERRATLLGPFTPNDIVDVSLASACVLWATSDGPEDKEIARATGYADARGARVLVERVFGMSLDDCRRTSLGRSAIALLASSLTAWSERTKREREREREREKKKR